MSAQLFLPIEVEVTLAEVRKRLRKKGLVEAANAKASQFEFSWTATGENPWHIPENSPETYKIAAGVFVSFPAAA